MTLSELIGNVTATRISGDLSVAVTGLCFDSRQVAAGNIFFAVRGTASDGHDYIGIAVEKGAVAVISEQMPDNAPDTITWVVVPRSDTALGLVASTWYGNPSARLRLVGVTGTNGKTTTVTLLHGLFLSLGYGTGLISTIVNKVNNEEVPATHTTPDPLRLNALLADMVKAGCEYCFMEVSSHAADQQRIAGLTFAGAVFTNLTHDHLDYHKTFDAYLQAKKSFFDNLPDGAFALVNKDDRNGAVMLQNTKASRYFYSLRAMADFRCRVIENRFSGLHLEIEGQESWFRLTGLFNAYNLLAVFATGVLLGQDPTEVLTKLSASEPVAGRFNYLISPENITGIVDYAHTPDALKNVLETINGIRTHNEQVITVVGAGGNRDAAKRPLMAKIAVHYSNRVILTSDNPRNEEPDAILAEMRAGIEPHQSHKVLVIADRLEAIRTAFAMAHSGDIILVAGKGHETYQEIKGVRHHFDDREVLAGLFGNVHNVKR